MDEVEKRLKVGELKHNKYITFFQVLTALFAGVLLSSFIEKTSIPTEYSLGIFIAGIIFVVIICGWRLNSIEAELLEIKVDKEQAVVAESPEIKVDKQLAFEAIKAYEDMHLLLCNLNKHANLNEWDKFNDNISKIQILRDGKPSIFDTTFNTKFLNKAMSVTKDNHRNEDIINAIKEIKIRIDEIKDKYELSI